MTNLLSRRTKDVLARRLSCTVLATVLVTSLSSTLIYPLQANAQGITITTSADSHAGVFFGEGAVQILVNDPDADDEDLQETISVDIDADPDDGTSTAGTFTIAETSESSGVFEFYLLHTDSALVASDFDANNTNGAFEHPVAGSPAVGTAEASIIRFGPGGDLALATSDLFEDVSFAVTVGGEEIVVDYKEASSTLELDKSTYGIESLAYITVIDQDGNLNPTEPDSFDATATQLNTLLFDVTGAVFDDAVTFEETGANTARFEGVVQISGLATLSDDELVINSEAVEMTLNDIADYVSISNPTASNDTSSRSFDVDDVDGELDPIGIVTFASELETAVRDNDRNRDSKENETLDDVVMVAVDVAGGDVEFLERIVERGHEGDDRQAFDQRAVT